MTRMKELLNFITLIIGKIKESGTARLVLYLLITAALIAAFLLLPEKEIGFIYNNF